MKYRPIVIGISSLLGVVLVSCSDPQEKAAVKLERAGFAFNVADYLRAAGEGERQEVFESFYTAGMEVDAADSAGKTALTRAVEAGHLDTAKYLIGKGANVNHVLSGGVTPLFRAVSLGDDAMVKELLAAGADSRAKIGSMTPMMEAASRNYPVIVERLVGSANHSELDIALQLASDSGSASVVDILLTRGASVFARSPENQTALMYAAAAGNMDVVRLLLKNGANRYALNGEDETAATMAQAKGHAEVVSYLNDPDSGVTPSHGFPSDDPRAALVAMATEAVGSLTGGSGASMPSFAGQPSDPGGRGGSGDSYGQSRRELPRLAGAEVALPERVGSKTNSVDSMARLHSYSEQQLPVILEAVAKDGSGAEVRRLSGASDDGSAQSIVKPGNVIPGTGFKVVGVERKFIHSKQGKGELVDVSQMVIEEGVSGQRHLVVKGIPAKSSETYATVGFGNGDLYDARPQDEFQVVGDAAARYRIVDVRPTQFVMENLETSEIITVGRGGIVGR